MMTEDYELVKRACQGDTSAFSSLVSRHYDKMFGLAFKLTGNRSWAEDITQEVCLRLPSRLDGFEGRSLFTTWVYKIVVNATHDYRRKQERHDRVCEGWGDIESDRRLADNEKHAAHDWLVERLSGLGQEIRDTVILVVLEDMTHAAAAQALDVSEGTVSWRMSEAKKQLRAIKEQEE